jgi:hypothetical protein
VTLFSLPHSTQRVDLRPWWEGPGGSSDSVVAFAEQPQNEQGRGRGHCPQEWRSGASSSGTGASLPPAGVRPASFKRRWQDGSQLLALRNSACPRPLSPKRRLQGGQWLTAYYAVRDGTSKVRRRWRWWQIGSADHEEYCSVLACVDWYSYGRNLRRGGGGCSFNGDERKGGERMVSAWSVEDASNSSVCMRALCRVLCFKTQL